MRAVMCEVLGLIYCRRTQLASSPQIAELAGWSRWPWGLGSPWALGSPRNSEAITGLALTLTMIVRLPRVGVPHACSSHMDHAWQICYS